MSQLPERADVVVVGGGICGQASAASAASKGASVVLVEKEAGPAAEASRWAQGSLRLQGREAAEFPLAQEAMRLWAEAGAEARAHDEDFELAFNGNIYVCEDEREMPMLRRLTASAHAAGVDGVRLLSPHEARELMPSLEGPFVAAMYSPVDGACQPEKATRFFASRALRRGVSVHYNTTATRIVERGGAVSGVETDRGVVRTSRVVVAGGVWTPYLAETVDVRLPVMPVALTGAETTPAAKPFAQTVRALRFGARPRPGGSILFSAGLNTTVDHALSLYDLRHLRLWAPRLLRHWRDVRLSFDLPRIAQQARQRATRSPALIGPANPRHANRRAMCEALDAMKRLIPSTNDVSIARVWSGLVDMSPDGLPIIDGDAGPEGLVVVTGLSGHGLTLGPVIGEIAADLAVFCTTQRPIRPFRLRRFWEERVPIPAKMI